ncbi:THO complex subunit 4B [Ziziphus jujuba]|uniref:THO complex subunit 4B n=2 Tax=Ziziphus jujuba TaxID=326968 RepID=A0A6P3ZDI3_ZIZJJ|nr:THO complex subunit 4B [Ziziphus jujuba]KAH7537235.1 hypothetical protein FEM48_Zijuj03G0071500 [Ziziphus jujuba var. spinosa]
MADQLDMSLEDIIKKNKKTGGYNGNSATRGRAGGGGAARGRGGSSSGPGPERRFQNRNPARTTPYYTALHPLARFRGRMLMQPLGVSGQSDVEKSTKLYVSNLDYGVSNSDIKILFSDVGELKQYSIHYDRSGRSKGTAEVVFARHGDAVAAINKYNNVRLDGKPLKIEFVGGLVDAPTLVPPTRNNKLERFNGSIRRGRQAGSRELTHGNFGHGNLRGRGQGRNQHERVTVEDLDAELECYRLQSMQIS